MTQPSVILFDLDGTLTDPKEGITSSVRHALAYFGIENPEMETLERFIGPPLIQSFQEFYGFSPEKALAAAEKYREYFPIHGIFANVPYPGVKEMLTCLKEAGKTLYVATSKDPVFANRILEHFELDGYFTAVAGGALQGPLGSKAGVIAHLLQEQGLQASKELIMVGDRHHDVIGARANGLDCIGVLFGYGSREELLQAGAVAVVSDMPALGDLLLAGW